MVGVEPDGGRKGAPRLFCYTSPPMPTALRDPDLTAEFQPLPAELVRLMQPGELAEYSRLLEAYTALLSPLNFAVHTSGADRMAHVELLDEWLTALVEGRLYANGPGPPPAWNDAEGRFGHPQTGAPVVYRLAIAMPPRHGKSYLTSHHLPAWHAIRFPNRHVAVASYEAEFAASWGKKARDLVEEYGPNFGVLLDSGSKASNRWGLAKPYTGGMLTAGAGGPFTGKGAHVIVIDDPVKNAAEAMSETLRMNLKEWYLSVAFTRLEPIEQDGHPTPGRIILMNTRWHEDDLQGYVTSAEPERWAVLNLPAIAVEGQPDPLGREPGEALAPERFPIGVLESIRDAQGAYWFGAMYQGNPQIEGGGILPGPYRHHRMLQDERGDYWYHFTDAIGAEKRVAVADCYRFATCDLAITTKTSASWSVVAVWDVTPDKELMLFTRWRVRMEAPEHEAQIRAWLSSIPLQPRIQFLGIEDRTFGTSLIQTFQRNGGLTVRPLKADTDKVTRALPAGQLMMQGRVFFPAKADWLEEWEHELASFDKGTHDDQVDVLAYAAKALEVIPVRRPARDQTPVTMQERVNAMLDRRNRTKRRPRAPVLGRW